MHRIRDDVASDVTRRVIVAEDPFVIAFLPQSAAARERMRRPGPLFRELRESFQIRIQSLGFDEQVHVVRREAVRVY